MMPNSFLITFGKDASGATESESGFANVSLFTRDLNPRFINLQKMENGFALFIGETHLHKEGDQHEPAGTSITYNDARKILTIECDRLGTGIVFWTYRGGTFSVSNRMENLITEEVSPDWSSIQQYLYTGFTIKNSTFYKEIFQTQQNSVLQAQLNDGSPVLTVSQREPSVSVKASSQADALIDEIGSQLSQNLTQTHPSVLMMSAGWDSRTLLLERTARIVGAYSHGDLSSREIHLARKLSGNERLDHLFTDVESCALNNTLIDEMLEQLGFGVFPIWFVAAKNIRRWKDAPIMSGVLGELLGGHYGLMSWGSRRQKTLSSLLLINESLVGEGRLRSVVDQYATPPSTHWFVSAEGQSMLDGHRQETRQKVIDAIDEHYEATGNWQRALEDFNMAHRARQYILKQAQAASSTVGYTIPFADSRLADLVRAVDYSHRVHNKVNRRVLQKRYPELLNEPMAATLVAAKYPILIQELSRFGRVLGENAIRLLGAERPRLGWFNYEHLYEGKVLHEITDSLNSPIWDKQKMHSTLQRNPENNIDAGSTLDMLCKIKTVDHYLSKGSTV